MTVLDTCSAILGGSADKELLHNNSNKASEMFSTQRDFVAGEVSKALARDILPKHIMDAHDSGAIHYHDLDYSPAFGMTNCCVVDLEGMLNKGFKMGQARIESPRGIQTACTITTQIIAQVASAQYGGTSINRIDEILAPYVDRSYYKNLTEGKKYMENDKAVVYATDKTKQEVYDACQTMEYQVNTLTTSNGQSPFVTFGFGLGTSWQARAIQSAILNVRIK